MTQYNYQSRYSAKRGVVFAAVMTAAVLGTTLVPYSAEASQQRMCGKRDRIAQILQTRYEEAPIGLGVGQSGKTVYEIYTSAKGSWTVMVTMTTGVSCIMASGHSWKGENPISHLPRT